MFLLKFLQAWDATLHFSNLRISVVHRGLSSTSGHLPLSVPNVTWMWQLTDHFVKIHMKILPISSPQTMLQWTPSYTHLYDFSRTDPWLWNYGCGGTFKTLSSDCSTVLSLSWELTSWLPPLPVPLQWGLPLVKAAVGGHCDITDVGVGQNIRGINQPGDSTACPSGCQHLFERTRISMTDAASQPGAMPNKTGAQGRERKGRVTFQKPNTIPWFYVWKMTTKEFTHTKHPFIVQFYHKYLGLYTSYCQC